MTRPPLFPSDLEGRGRLPTPLQVAGRVLESRDSSALITDAFARLALRFERPVELGPGDLILARGRYTGRRLERARLVSRVALGEPRGDGEVGRMVFSGVGERLRARARVVRSIREFFEEQGFLEVETPIRVPAPGVDDHLTAVAASGGYLVTSPELQMKRLLVGGVPRLFQLGRVTRGDEAGAWHEPEFSLLEWYRAFSGKDRVMRDTEILVSRAARALRGKAEMVAASGRRISLRPPFERLSVAEAFRKHAGVRDVFDLSESDEGRYFELLVERVEPALARLRAPVFLCDYPIAQGALARAKPGDPRVAERFELYVAGVELSNGYAELTDPKEQRRRFAEQARRRRAQNKRPYPVDRRFLAALEEGMPESAGNALGLDRLVALLCGEARLDQVIAFPWALL